MPTFDNRTANYDLLLPHPDNLLADDVVRLIDSLEILDAEAAPLESPALTGAPTAPTAETSTNNDQIATTAFVVAKIDDLIDSAPGALDTLLELANALGNDPNFATTVTNALASKAPLASPALTGTPTAPTAAAGANNSQIATTAFVTGGYQQNERALNGDFAVSGGAVICSRRDNVVTITSKGNLTATASGSFHVSTFAIPSQYRPTSNVAFLIKGNNANTYTQIKILTSGIIQFYNLGGNNDFYEGFSISYIVY